MGLLWTFSTAPTFRSRNLSRSSSGFSRTTSLAPLEKTRWEGGFTCPHCGVVAEPFRIATRPGILTCRSCRRQTGLLVGAVMERSHTPLSVWFWAAYLVASQTQGMSAVQFQRQLGLTRYETAFGVLHKLRAGMVRPDQDRIGGRTGEHVEVDETYVGGRNSWRRARYTPRDAGDGCRRGSSPGAGHGAGQAEGWSLCRSRGRWSSPTTGAAMPVWGLSGISCAGGA